MSKTDIQMKAEAFDAFVESQIHKPVNGLLNNYSSGLKGAADSLSFTYEAMKYSQAQKVKNELLKSGVDLSSKHGLPRVKCKGNHLICDKPDAISILISTLAKGDEFYVKLSAGITKMRASLTGVYVI